MGKRMTAALTNFDATKNYSLKEAVDIIKKNATAKFDETVEIHVHLGVDPKKQINRFVEQRCCRKGLGKPRWSL
jgi:ribosomal protein L1